VHAENDNWTCFEQSASLDVKNFFGLESAVEKLAVRQYGANLAKGKEILEYFIEELLKTTTHIERFRDPEQEEKASAADSAIELKESSDGDAVVVEKAPMLCAETEEMKTARATASLTTVRSEIMLVAMLAVRCSRRADHSSSRHLYSLLHLILPSPPYS
uniref:PRELI/MSF1 domain-containing protein n=1 Tax=Caenorhabditis japonica TaxID=281687 RepID=A0A8R1EMP6_CAEJA